MFISILLLIPIYNYFQLHPWNIKLNKACTFALRNSFLNLKALSLCLTRISFFSSSVYRAQHRARDSALNLCRALISLNFCMPSFFFCLSSYSAWDRARLFFESMAFVGLPMLLQFRYNLCIRSICSNFYLLCLKDIMIITCMNVSDWKLNFNIVIGSSYMTSINYYIRGAYAVIFIRIYSHSKIKTNNKICPTNVSDEN